MTCDFEIFQASNLANVKAIYSLFKKRISGADVSRVVDALISDLLAVFSLLLKNGF